MDTLRDILLTMVQDLKYIDPKIKDHWSPLIGITPEKYASLWQDMIDNTKAIVIFRDIFLTRSVSIKLDNKYDSIAHYITNDGTNIPLLINALDDRRSANTIISTIDIFINYMKEPNDSHLYLQKEKRPTWYSIMEGRDIVFNILKQNLIKYKITILNRDYMFYVPVCNTLFVDEEYRDSLRLFTKNNGDY